MINSGNFETQKPVKIIGLSITKNLFFVISEVGISHKGRNIKHGIISTKLHKKIQYPKILYFL